MSDRAPNRLRLMMQQRKDSTLTIGELSILEELAIDAPEALIEANVGGLEHPASPGSEHVLNALVRTLNSSHRGDAAIGRQKRLRALTALSALAKKKSARAEVMRAVHQLSQGFEEHVSRDTDRPEGQQSLRAMLLVVLVRGSEYQLTAAELCELCDGSPSTCVATLEGALLEPPPLEPPLVRNLSGLLSGLSEPLTVRSPSWRSVGWRRCVVSLPHPDLKSPV